MRLGIALNLSFLFYLFCSITLMFRYKNSPNFGQFYFVIFCAIVSLYILICILYWSWVFYMGILFIFHWSSKLLSSKKLPSWCHLCFVCQLILIYVSSLNLKLYWALQCCMMCASWFIIEADCSYLYTSFGQRQKKCDYILKT